MSNLLILNLNSLFNLIYKLFNKEVKMNTNLLFNIFR